MTVEMRGTLLLGSALAYFFAASRRDRSLTDKTASRTVLPNRLKWNSAQGQLPPLLLVVLVVIDHGPASPGSSQSSQNAWWSMS
jgi:hypothetical protein